MENKRIRIAFLIAFLLIVIMFISTIINILKLTKNFEDDEKYNTNSVNIVENTVNM